MSQTADQRFRVRNVCENAIQNDSSRSDENTVGGLYLGWWPDFTVESVRRCRDDKNHILVQSRASSFWKSRVDHASFFMKLQDRQQLRRVGFSRISLQRHRSRFNLRPTHLQAHTYWIGRQPAATIPYDERSTRRPYGLLGSNGLGCADDNDRAVDVLPTPCRNMSSPSRLLRSTFWNLVSIRGKSDLNRLDRFAIVCVCHT